MSSDSMVGSSWNIADSNGLAPIKSPAATKMLFLWPSRSCRTSVAMYSEPPAGTIIFLALSPGSVIRMPPGGGRRLPWKSLIARIRRSTVSLVWAMDWQAGDNDASSATRIGNIGRVMGIIARRDVYAFSGESAGYILHDQR